MKFQQEAIRSGGDVELGLGGCPAHHQSYGGPGLPYFVPPPPPLLTAGDAKSLHLLEKRHYRAVRMAQRERNLKLTAYGCVVFIAVVLLLAIALGIMIFLRAHPELWQPTNEQ